MAIGGTVTAGTTGSVLFIGAGPVLAQDNANLFWDNTSKRLGINVNSALGRALTVYDATVGGGPVLIRSTVTTGYSSVSCLDSANIEKGTFGYGNSAVGNSVASLNFWYSPFNDIVFTPDAVTNTHRFGVASGSSFHELTDGASAGVSAAGAMRLRYNAGTDKFQVSKNGAAYIDIA